MMAHILEHRDRHWILWFGALVQKQGAPLLKKVVNYTLFMTKTAEKLTLWGCTYLFSYFENRCLTNREKLSRPCRTLLGNGGFTVALLNLKGVSAWWKETAQTRVFLLFRSLLLNRLEPQSSKAKLLLPIIPIDLFACAFTLLPDNLCRNSCISHLREYPRTPE